MAFGTLVGSLLGGFIGRQVALEIPGLGDMTEHEVETMYTTIEEQLSRAGVEPDPSLSPKQVVVQMLENSNKGDGLPFQVRMTASHAAEQRSAVWSGTEPGYMKTRVTSAALLGELKCL
jgi:hypothetical protein